MTLTASQQLELEKPVTRFVYFVAFYFVSGTAYVCTAGQTITWGGHDWLGLGSVGSISQVEEAAGAASSALNFGLNIAQPSWLAESIGAVEDYRGQPAKMYMLSLIHILIPLMQVMTDTMLDAETKTADLANAFNPLTETLRGLLIIGNRFYDTFAQIGIVLAATTAQLVALSEGNFSGVSAIQDQAKADLAAMDARTEALQEHLLNANDDKLKIEQDYQADSLTVMQFYLDKSVAVQQKAQWDLAKAFGTVSYTHLQ